jgi:hypothetical protein
MLDPFFLGPDAWPKCLGLGSVLGLESVLLSLSSNLDQVHLPNPKFIGSGRGCQTQVNKWVWMQHRVQELWAHLKSLSKSPWSGCNAGPIRRGWARRTYLPWVRMPDLNFLGQAVLQDPRTWVCAPATPKQLRSGAPFQPQVSWVWKGMSDPS